MKRLFLFLVFLLAVLLLEGVSFCQGFTQVSAQVMDVNGSVYSSCVASVTFVPSPTATQMPTLGGNNQTFQTQFAVAGCDTQGNFSLTLADNNQVVDGHTGLQGSQWIFKILTAPGAFTPQLSFTYTGTITGTAMNLTTAFQMVAATLPIAGNVQVGTIGNLSKYGSISTLVDSGISALTVSTKPLISDSAQYVSPNGNDANDGLSWGSAKLTITAACAALPSGNASCSTGTGTIFLSPGYTGTIPLITSTISIIGGRWNEYQVYASQDDCSKTAGIINIQIGTVPAGQAAGIANQCVGIYSSVIADATRTLVWGENPIAIVNPGQAMGWTLWGSESDVDVSATTIGQAIGYDAVSTNGFRPSDGTITSATTRPTWAFSAFAATLGSTPWNIGYVCDNSGAACFGFQPPDSGLKITQSVTSSGSPQNVTTNAIYGLNRLNVSSWISMDTGVNQEDVQVLSLTCTVGQSAINSCPPSGTFIINAVFTKNHANNATLFQYSSDRLWDAAPALSRFPAYRIGDLRNYLNTSNPLGWSVIDTAGIDRLYDFILSNGVSGGPANLHVFRDVGGGWQFQNTAGVGILNIASSGDIGAVGGITFPNATQLSWLDNGGISRPIFSLDALNNVVMVGQPVQKTIAFQPGVGTSNLTITNTAVSVLGVPLSAPTTISGVYQTATNCAAIGSPASPSVAGCGASAAGQFSCSTVATGATCQVNTTAITATSEIFVFESDTTTTGSALGVTCNTSTNVLPASRLLASSVVATSFTINLGTVTTDPACFSYEIIN